MKKEKVYFFIGLFLLSVLFLHLFYCFRFDFIRDHAEGYVRGESVYEERIDDPDDSTSLKTTPFDLHVRRTLRHSKDSVVLLFLSDSISDRKSIVSLIPRIMEYKPAAIGLDAFSTNEGSNLEYNDSIISLSRQYSNLVLPYSIAHLGTDFIEYPLGIKDYEEIPQLGFTNFGTKGNEIRYLENYRKVGGVRRPAFWTRLWEVSHPGERIRSKRNYINFKMLNVITPFPIRNLQDLDESYMADMFKGKIIIIGKADPIDIRVVPILYKGDYTMPGALAIALATQTVTYNEASTNFIDKARHFLAIVLVAILCLITTCLHFSSFFPRIGSLFQLIIGLALYYFAEFIASNNPGNIDFLYDLWYYFGITVIFVLIAAATTNILVLINQGFKKLKKHGNDHEKQVL